MHRFILLICTLMFSASSVFGDTAPTLSPACKQRMIEQGYLYSNGQNPMAVLDQTFEYGRHYNVKKVVEDYQTSLHTFAQGLWLTKPLHATALFLKQCLDRPEACHGHFAAHPVLYEPLYCQAEIVSFVMQDVQNTIFIEKQRCQIQPHAYFDLPLMENQKYRDQCLQKGATSRYDFKTYNQEIDFLANQSEKIEQAVKSVARNSADQELFYYAYAHMLQDFQTKLASKAQNFSVHVLGFQQELQSCSLRGNLFTQQVQKASISVEQQTYYKPQQIHNQTYVRQLYQVYAQQRSPEVPTEQDQTWQPSDLWLPASTVTVHMSRKELVELDSQIQAQIMPAPVLLPGDEFKQENRYAKFKADIAQDMHPWVVAHLAMQHMLNDSYQSALEGEHYQIQSWEHFKNVFRHFVCELDTPYCEEHRFKELEPMLKIHHQAYQDHHWDAAQLVQDIAWLGQEMTRVNQYCLQEGVSSQEYQLLSKAELHNYDQRFQNRTSSLIHHPFFEVLMGSSKLRKMLGVYDHTPFERCMQEGTAFGPVHYNDAFLKLLEPYRKDKQFAPLTFNEHTYFASKKPKEMFAAKPMALDLEQIKTFLEDTKSYLQTITEKWQVEHRSVVSLQNVDYENYLSFIIQHFPVPLAMYSAQRPSREYGHYLCLALQDYDSQQIREEINRDHRTKAVMVASILLVPFSMGKSLFIPAMVLGSGLYTINGAYNLINLYDHKKLMEANVATGQIDWQEAALELERLRSSIKHEWTYLVIASAIGGAVSGNHVLKQVKELWLKSSKSYKQIFDKAVLRLEEMYKIADPLEQVHNLRHTKVGKILRPNQEAVHFLGSPSLRTSMADRLAVMFKSNQGLDDWLEQFQKHIISKQTDQAIAMIEKDLPNVAKEFSLSAFRNTTALEQLAHRYPKAGLDKGLKPETFLHDPLFRHALGKKLADAPHLNGNVYSWLAEFERYIVSNQTRNAMAMVQKDFPGLARKFRLSTASKIPHQSAKPLERLASNKPSLRVKMPSSWRSTWQSFMNVLEKHPRLAQMQWKRLVKALDKTHRSPQRIYQAEKKLVALMERLEVAAAQKPSALPWFNPAQTQDIARRMVYHRKISGVWVRGHLKKGKWISYTHVRNQIWDFLRQKSQFAPLPDDLMEKLIHPLVRSHLLDDLDWLRLAKQLDRVTIQTEVDVRAFREAVDMIGRHNKSLAAYIRPGHTASAKPNLGQWLKGNRKLNPYYYRHRRNYLIDHFADAYQMQRYARYRMIDAKYQAAERLARSQPGRPLALENVYRVIDQDNPFAAPLQSLQPKQVRQTLKQMEQTDVIVSLLQNTGRRDTYLQFEWRGYQKAMASLEKKVDELIAQGQVSMAQWKAPFRTFDFHRRIRGECVTPTSSLTTVANAGLAKIMIWMSTLIEFSTYSTIHHDDELDYEFVTRGLHEVGMQGVFAPTLRYLAFTGVSPIALYKMLSEAAFFSFIGAPIEALEFQAGESLIWGHDGKLLQNDNLRKQLFQTLETHPELITMADNPWLDWSEPALAPVRENIQDVLQKAQRMSPDATEDQWFDWFLQKELTHQMQTNEELEDYVVDQFSVFLQKQEEAEKEVLKAKGEKDIWTFLTLGDESYQATVDYGVTTPGIQYYMFNRGWMVVPSLGASYLTSQAIVSLLCRQRLNHLWNVKAATTFFVGSYTGIGLWYLHARNQTMGK